MLPERSPSSPPQSLRVIVFILDLRCFICSFRWPLVYLLVDYLFFHLVIFMGFLCVCVFVVLPAVVMPRFLLWNDCFSWFLSAGNTTVFPKGTSII